MYGQDSFQILKLSRNLTSNFDMLRSIAAPGFGAAVFSTACNLVFGLRAEVGPPAASFRSCLFSEVPYTDASCATGP